VPEVSRSISTSQHAPSQLPLRAIGCGVLIFIPLCAAGLVWWLLRIEPLVERVVRDSNAFEGAVHPRPAHVSPPVPGTFAQAVEPLLPEAHKVPEPEPDSVARLQEDDEAASEAWSRAFTALQRRCREVASGMAPLETMPPPCRKELEEGRELMRRVLAATHAEIGGLPAGAGSLSRTGSYLHPSAMKALGRVVRWAALETRVLLAAGQPEQAVDTCLDALALSRELSLGGGLHGGKLSASTQELAYRPCAAALDAAPVGRKRQALEQLARLLEGLPPPSALLREESVFHQLEVFGPEFLSVEDIARLPPAGRTLINSRGGWFYFTSRLGHPLLRRYLWRRNVSLFDAMVGKADLPPAERQRAFVRLDAEHALLAGLPGAVHAVEYQRELASMDAQRLQAEVLVALVQVDLARAEQGRWPAALPAGGAQLLRLEILGGQEARVVPGDAALEGHALRLTADGAP
jgi:hypothetical protein